MALALWALMLPRSSSLEDQPVDRALALALATLKARVSVS
jgi:hypothetical protein